MLVLLGLNVSGGELALDDCKYVSEAKAEELKRGAVGPNDIVIMAVGSSGQAFLIPEGFPRAVLSQNFSKISPDQRKVHPVCLELALNSRIVQRQFFKNITGTVRTFLSLTKIKKVYVPAPPLNLQRRFVAIAEKQKTTYRSHLAEFDSLFVALQSRAL